MRKLTLISYKLCPYVQRVAIALAEKHIPFERIYIDLSARPDWFNAISPLGKVPLLKVEEDGVETILFESSVICEYLEEAYPDTPLHPATPIKRAQHRAWMEFGSAILGNIWQIEIASDQASHDKASTALARKFERLETVLGEGPLFAGSAFCLVDAVMAPAFRYFEVMDRYAGSSFTTGFPKLSVWRSNLAARDSVKNAIVEEYPDLLEDFLRSKNAWLRRAPLPTPASA